MRRFILAAFVLALLLGACIGCATLPVAPPAVKSTPTLQVSSPTSTPTPSRFPPLATRASGCIAHNGLPDATCTPGAIFAVTAAQVCKAGYAASVRNVPESEKTAVYHAYSIGSHLSGQYEVDHLISLELGGSNSIANLWPELAAPVPGFHQKDAVENYLHAQVCSGAISLLAAQEEIARNWLAVYASLPKSLRVSTTAVI